MKDFWTIIVDWYTQIQLRIEELSNIPKRRWLLSETLLGSLAEIPNWETNFSIGESWSSTADSFSAPNGGANYPSDFGLLAGPICYIKIYNFKFYGNIWGG